MADFQDCRRLVAGESFALDLWMVTTDSSDCDDFLDGVPRPGFQADLVTFQMLGAWDALTIAPGRRPMPKPSVVVDRSGFDAFPLHPVSSTESFLGFIRSQPLVLVSFLKVHGVLAALGGFAGVAAVGQHLASPAGFGGPSKCQLLFTLGSSQIVAFLSVTEWEKATELIFRGSLLTAGEVPGLMELLHEMNPKGFSHRFQERSGRRQLKPESLPVLAKTRTCLGWRSAADCSREQLLRPPPEQLGPACFTMAIDSTPTHEGLLSEAWLKHFRELGEVTAGVMLSQGTDDIRIPMLRVSNVCAFLDRLTEFRGEFGKHMGRLSTTTVPLRSIPLGARPVSTVVVSSGSLQEELRNSLTDLQGSRGEEVRARFGENDSSQIGAPVSGSDPATREVRDVIIAANAFLSDPELASDFVDVHSSLRELNRLIRVAKARQFADQESLHLVRQHANTVNAALHERSRNLLRAAGPMAGPTFHSHATGPHGYLKAWENVMNMLFYSVTGRGWIGCVVSTQEPGIWHDRTSPLLRVPLRLLDRPIPHLVRLSHEAGHLVFNYASAARPDLSPDQQVRNRLTEISQDYYERTRSLSTTESAEALASEMFAVWFEYHFAGGDRQFCLNSAWYSWTRSEMAYQNPGEVLLRTAAMIAVDQIYTDRKTDYRDRDQVRRLAERSVDEALSYISTACLRGVKLPGKQAESCRERRTNRRDTLRIMAIPLLCDLSRKLSRLENDVRSLVALPADCAAEPKMEKAVVDLLGGRVVTEPVPNYLALVLRLARRYFDDPDLSGSALVRTNFALALSLAHVYDTGGGIPVQSIL